MIVLSLIPPPLVYVLAGLFGVILGGALNIVVHRLPYCGSAVTFYSKLPLGRYFSGRGRCEEGIAHTSTRYPIIEVVSALLCLAAVRYEGLTFALPFDLVFLCALTALVFFDGEHMILPDVITIPGFGFALIARVAIPYLIQAPHFDDVPGIKEFILQGWSDSPTSLAVASLIGALLGALVGAGSLWLMGEAWKRLRNIEAMGLGDVKMMLMVGAYLGWRLTILTIFVGALSGSIGGVVLTVYEGRRDFQRTLPYGVCLGIAAILALFVGSQIVNWYAGFYQ
ncbi:MAG TPA: A24 family peptidase [Pyrinomonadaceae bacterium]|jgi:leader peptidase (prepilin peptidase)/N-methyltransferase